MNRSNYSEESDDDNWAFIRWRGAVESAIRGKRGQEFLKELKSLLEKMPDKRLAANRFGDSENGCLCTLGVMAHNRGVDFSDLDIYIEDDCVSDISEQIGKRLGIAPALAAEIMFVNDNVFFPFVPEKESQRYSKMLQWIQENIKAEK